jgi:hypothetical protein
MDFLALTFLYFVHRASKTDPKDYMGNMLFLVLAAFGIIFLLIDVAEKIKGLF